MAQKVKDVTAEDVNKNNSVMPQIKQDSIPDELRLANEFQVFTFTSIDPDIKCSKIVSSISVGKLTPELLLSWSYSWTHCFPMDLDLALAHLMLLGATGLLSIVCQGIQSVRFCRRISPQNILSSILTFRSCIKRVGGQKKVTNHMLKCELRN